MLSEFLEHCPSDSLGRGTAEMKAVIRGRNLKWGTHVQTVFGLADVTERHQVLLHPPPEESFTRPIDIFFLSFVKAYLFYFILFCVVSTWSPVRYGYHMSN